MFRMIMMAVVVFVFMTPCSSYANAVAKGEGLKKFCSVSKPDIGDKEFWKNLTEYVACTSIIIGVYQAHATIFKNPSLSSYFFCTPRGVTWEQMRLVVLKWLQNHPESLHKPSGHLILTALASAFPCKK